MTELAERIEQLSPLQRAIYALKETQARLEQLERQLAEPIALVGMACRFPGGVNDPAGYWRLLCDGVDAVGEVPEDRWDVEAFYDPDPKTPGKMNTRRGGFLDEIDRFDNRFFGISNQEAEQLDPQQRMLLELTWEALEDAGLPPENLRGSQTGVFVGISVSEYSMLLTQDLQSMGPLFSTGTASSIAANRISFNFDWHGPSVALDTACSSSLVALNLACQAIRNGQCTMAVVGGTNAILAPTGNIVLTKSGLSAPDGRVRAFDRAASGYVRSEGVGVLVLKPLSAAEADGDPIYAVIRGAAVTQTGRANGISAPVGRTHEATLRAACEQAKISPARIAYIEAQGTGTLIGDAIEAKALGGVIAEDRSPESQCLLGSAKTNIGHLEAASGIASVMKVALALKHGRVPPSLHFESPNPMIPFDELPLRVNTDVELFQASDEPVVASVNGFGYGGSNAHVVLEQYHSVMQSSPTNVMSGDAAADSDELYEAVNKLGQAPRRYQKTPRNKPSCSEPVPFFHSLYVLPLSARTEAGLKDLANRYREFLLDNPHVWHDVALTATHRREHHDCRLAVIASSTCEAADQIAAYLRGEETGRWLSGRRPLNGQVRQSTVTSAPTGLESARWLAQLYIASGDDQFKQQVAGDYRAVRLPTYAWQKQRLWVDAPNPWNATAAKVECREVKTAEPSDGIQPRPDLNAPLVQPETELERQLCGAWATVLQVEPVGVLDNFFELGGQSLQAAILLSKLHDSLGVQLDLITLFEVQTVRELAAYLQTNHPDLSLESIPQVAKPNSLSCTT